MALIDKYPSGDLINWGLVKCDTRRGENQLKTTKFDWLPEVQYLIGIIKTYHDCTNRYFKQKKLSL